MRLYYHPRSTCSRRVLMTAHHLGTALDLVPVDLLQGAQHTPDFLRLNPNHRVPVLEHEGFVLWESYAIMQYLADCASGSDLYPRDLRSRADVNRWLFWCGQDFMPGVSLLNWENAIKALAGLGAPDAEAVARGEGLLAEAAGLLDAHLAHREWVCGAGLSLADFALGAPLIDQERARLPIADLPHLQRWLGRLRALDAWQATVA